MLNCVLSFRESSLLVMTDKKINEQTLAAICGWTQALKNNVTSKRVFESIVQEKRKWAVKQSSKHLEYIGGRWEETRGPHEATSNSSTRLNPHLSASQRTGVRRTGAASYIIAFERGNDHPRLASFHPRASFLMIEGDTLPRPLLFSLNELTRLFLRHS
jgi:hypothetical protein